MADPLDKLALKGAPLNADPGHIRGNGAVFYQGTDRFTGPAAGAGIGVGNQALPSPGVHFGKGLVFSQCHGIVSGRNAIRLFVIWLYSK